MDINAQILDSIEHPVVAVTPDYRVKYMNKAAISLCGPVKIDSPFCYQVIQNREQHCREYGDECPAIAVFATGKKCLALRTRFTETEGENLYEIEAFPLLDSQDQVQYVIEIFRNIGESPALREQQQLIAGHAELNRVFKLVEKAKQEWEMIMDCIEDPLLMADADEKIKRFNWPMKNLMNLTSQEILGQPWKEFLLENGMREGDFFGDQPEMAHEQTGKFFGVKVFALRDKNKVVTGSVVTLHDISERKKFIKQLEDAYAELKNTHSQMLQQEKLASIGQLAAGVAHEINNPIGFVSSNLVSLGKYAQKLLEYITSLSQGLMSHPDPTLVEEMKTLRRKLKIDFIAEDMAGLINESLDGIDRVKKIVANLKSFSRVDQAEQKPSDINECIESTINIVWNELKYKTTVTKEYGKLPLTCCYPQQLNQVFMNLLVNAAQAIDNKGAIAIRTWHEGSNIMVSIADTGRGIAPEHLTRIFEPFFTTKQVGKGTGLGLSIAYDIITKKHHGELSVESSLGQGTTFTVSIPVVEGETNG